MIWLGRKPVERFTGFSRTKSCKEAGLLPLRPPVDSCKSFRINEYEDVLM